MALQKILPVCSMLWADQALSDFFISAAVSRARALSSSRSSISSATI